MSFVFNVCFSNYCFFFDFRTLEPLIVKKKMEHKWTLCIEVSCFPNPGRATIRYVIYNHALNHTIERKKDVCGTTTNKEANYIALVEGLKEAKT